LGKGDGLGREMGWKGYHATLTTPTWGTVCNSRANMVDVCSALKYCKDPPSPQRHQLPAIRYVDDYRTLTELRKRSAGDQSIISIRIDEDDNGEQEEGREE